MFPESSLIFALLIGQFVPLVGACACFTYLCHHHVRALLAAAGGALLAWLLLPQIWIEYEYPNFYSQYFGYLYLAICPAIGAGVAGLIVYIIEFGRGRRSPHRSPPAVVVVLGGIVLIAALCSLLVLTESPILDIL